MKLHLPLFLRRTILTLMLAYGVPVLRAAALTLGAGDSLSVDYSVSGSLQNLNNGTLRLSGGTTLQLFSCGEGDGKTYTLLTGVSELLDAQGNVISLDSTNNAASRYFDATQPGSGFWAGATLQLTDAGTLQLVLHNETVKEAITITSRTTYLQYYAGIAFENISNVSSSDAYGGATYGSTITLCDNGSVSFSGNTASSSSSDSYAYGGAIYGDDDSTITLSNNGSVSFSENTASSSSYYSYYSACGGAIYGGTITLSDNGSVVFEGNTASSSLYSSTSGGAIYGVKDITLSDNGSVVFEGNTASSSDSYPYGGAIYGDYRSTITLNDNGSVSFIGNTASYGGAIYGGTFSTITLRNNGSVVFEGNTASYGGAIYGETITLSDNGSVVFEGNTASSSDSSAYGGAISGYGSTITLSDNGSVVFEGNTASSSDSPASGGAISGSSSTIMLSDNGSVVFEGNTASSSDSSAYGGAISGHTFTLSDNGSVTFSGNTASASSSSDSSAYGGAIDASGDLSIWNNDSVEFYKNAEVSGNTYRLRSVYAYGGSGDEISLSAAAGKSITFYDSVYIGSGATVNLNQDYTYQAEDGSSVTIKQQGDIIFTGKYTEPHLNDLLEAAGAGRTATATEMRLSRTTEVNAMTNLYGGRLRVEEGAIYQGRGITAMEGSGATVRVKNATLSHEGYDLTFNAGTTLELVGTNIITGNVQMQEGSNLSFDASETTGLTKVIGNVTISGALTIDCADTRNGENTVLAYVTDSITGWDTGNITILGSKYSIDDFSWVGNVLVLNYNEDTYNPYFRGDYVVSAQQTGNNISYEFYNNIRFAGISSSSSGGAIYGGSNGTITLSDNGSVVFEGNTASSGGAIYGYEDSTITLSNNGSVTFIGNTASSSDDDASGGAIYTYGDLCIQNNDSVEFYQNAEVVNGNTYRLRSIYADGGSGDVISLSAAAGKSITFRDSIYIGSGSTFKLNEAYEGMPQQGDIIFTGATTVDDLYTVKGNVAGTMEEIRLSRTTEVKTLTELYGGRLRIEAGAIYKGSGMTIVENSGASVWLRNAQMLHQGHNISFGKGTTFGLRGCNVSQSDNLFLEAGSSLSFDIAADNISTVVLTHTGALTLGGSVTLNIGTADSSLAHGQYKLLQVTDLSSLENWSNENLKMGDGSYTISDIEWVDNTLCFNYSGQKLSDLPILPEIPESEIPDTPVTPDEPEIPDTPVTPDEPEIPDTPVTPDEPEIPDTPVTPDEPEIPDTPVTPDEPEIPDTPVTPDEPEIPDTPVLPDEPEIPDTPVTPDEPEKPEPLKPFRPGDSALVSGEIDKTMEVILNGKGSLTLDGKVNAGAITVENDKNLTFKSNKKKPGSLTGDGDLTKKGKGTLTLNDGNSSWTGDTYLLAGIIKVKGTTSLGKGDVYVKGGTLNLGSKAIGNDIIQSKDAAIKSGKKFAGSYTLEKGELLKGSTLNIAKLATLEGGTVNGTLTGTGITTVTGKVTLGDKGKITTKALTLDEDATLTTSAKGLSSKATTLTIGENALFSVGGKMTVDSLKLNGGELKTTAAKPAAMTVKNNMELTDAILTTNGKVTTNKLTLNESTMTIKGAKAQNLTVKQGLTLGSGSSLRLNGKLSAGSLTIKSGGTLTMSGSKPVTLKVKGALTLNSGSSIILDYDFVQGKTYKVLTFGSYSGSSDYYSIFGVDADDCTITNTGKSLTLTVTGKWNPQTQQKAAAAEAMVVSAAKSNPVADALVQANWGQLEASRAFVNAMANRSMAVQLGNGERSVWASAIGSSIRHDTASGHNGADTNVSGGAFGLETQVGRASLFGLALGNSGTRVSAHGFGTIEQDTTHLGLYGQTNWRSGVTADWSAAYGRSESESMGSEWNQKQLQLDGRVSYNHELNANTVLSPFAGVQYYASDSAAIGTTDTGSLQNLRAEIGVAASHRLGKFGVYGEIALHQDMARNNPSVSMEGTRYTGMTPGRTGINFTIGASYELNDKWSVNASYTGEFVENANAHSANVGASYKF